MLVKKQSTIFPFRDKDMKMNAYNWWYWPWYIYTRDADPNSGVLVGFGSLFAKKNKSPSKRTFLSICKDKSCDKVLSKKLSDRGSDPDTVFLEGWIRTPSGSAILAYTYRIKDTLFSFSIFYLQQIGFCVL